MKPERQNMRPLLTALAVCLAASALIIAMSIDIRFAEKLLTLYESVLNEYLMTGYTLNKTSENIESNLKSETIIYEEDVLNTEKSEGFNDPISEAILKSLPAKAQEILRYGLPGIGQVRLKGDYLVLGYDPRLRIPNWVVEHLTPENLAGYNGSRQDHDFYEDQTLHPYFRSTKADYKRSGYDRGHMAPAGNHKKSYNDQRGTFVLSNIAPQVGKYFNRGIWNDLEMYIRNRLVKKYNETFIITGPMFLPRLDQTRGITYTEYQVIGKNYVAVPTHFFKVALGVSKDNDLVLESYLLPNQPLKSAIRQYLVPKWQIEKMSGLLLFDKIPLDSYRCVNRNCRDGDTY